MYDALHSKPGTKYDINCIRMTSANVRFLKISGRCPYTWKYIVAASFALGCIGFTKFKAECYLKEMKKSSSCSVA